MSYTLLLLFIAVISCVHAYNPIPDDGHLTKLGPKRTTVTPKTTRTSTLKPKSSSVSTSEVPTTILSTTNTTQAPKTTMKPIVESGDTAAALIVTDVSYFNNNQAEMDAGIIEGHIQELLASAGEPINPEWETERTLKNGSGFVNIEYTLQGKDVCRVVLHFAELIPTYSPEVYYTDVFCNGAYKGRFYRAY
ncbi:hypothetical protein L596_028745 [Steinernema carpocapsae]|uniref:SEA domain-containing protein n=1 Tax=Steinernema carpocapsae TaxID=34508 RepID=A0A4U5LZA0_STECR|nr:hypothetical protein L596_028745 [Steinernema carpocapsae]